MPRLARLDAVGLLQHVMVRGIERRDVFLDNRDRQRFLDHFSELLLKTDTACLAWCLMSNHFHLLLRPKKIKLSFFMRRLLTSYAVGFNLRHNRVGHLFQNRYKSIVCDEERYLLELLRYIHLNPLRAGLVRGVDDLGEYRWSGHSVLMGNADLPGQSTLEVLSLFSEDLVRAREKYRVFVLEAVDSGGRDELSSAGEIRNEALLPSRTGEEAYDTRVLGSGDFVEQLWEDQAQAVPEPKMELPSLLQEVASVYGLQVTSLHHSNKSRRISEARAVTCYLGLRELGYSGMALSKLLGITPAGVSVAAERGEELVQKEQCSDLLLKIRMLKS